MTTLYMVTTGDYDFEVHGVYSSREKAEYAKNIFMGEDIAQFELDRLPKHMQGHLLYQVDVRHDEVLSCEPFQVAANLYQHPVASSYFYHKAGIMELRVWARDEVHAVEVAKDKIHEMVKDGEWFV